ncbi:sensor histidine kinase [Phototrophicus methaneseepsis]|uniref:histidine kinase n=1 Tax=Phototrophicus methaneseepsis TaxID=2710758 RepID=A0A7S8E6L5_9CHLR|nr:sensor histidine kinase [Phototrophicus methaneseepsis]QPC81307.1 sensor histidine kinase [Phototrophicus methaneseepsis]
MFAKRQTVNPTLLSLFRMFVWIRISLAVLAVILRAASTPPRYGYLQILVLLIFIAMVLYLYSDYLQEQLGSLYLPIALATVTIGLSLSRPVVQLSDLQNGTGPIVETLRSISYAQMESLWNNETTPMFFFPLVLIAWQYSYREVLLFIATVVGIDFIIYFNLAIDPPQGLLNLLMITTSQSVTFMFVGYIVTVLSRILKEQRDALQDANRNLRHYMTTLDQLATSRERNRLARELHDTLAHSLSATTLQLEASSALWETNPEKSRALLDQSLKTTRAGLTETRRALEALRASPLDDLGLLLSLRQLALNDAEQAGYQLHMDLPDQVESMPFDVEQTIYRCAQETFSNIGRHAGAKHVSMQLIDNDSTVDLFIKDDGVGFNMQEVDPTMHFGIVGMQERVAIFGGTLDVTSKPDEGTSIHLHMGVK